MNATRTLALFAASVGIALSASAQTKLKWAHVYETSEPYHTQALWAAEEIKKRTNGRYLIEVFPASSLGKETDINQGLTLGTVDIIYTGASFAARSHAPLGVSYFPFIFRNAEHQFAYAKSPVFQRLADGYTKATGHAVLAMTYYGARQVTSNRPIAKPEDMKGLKIRVPDAPAYVAFPKSLGANATPIAFAEVYLALQNGTVEAQENPLPTIEAKKFYEVQKHISLTGHIVDALLTLVANGTWSKLSDADKKIFDEVAKEAAQRAGQQIMKREGELVDEFKKKGINVISVDKEAFSAAVLKNIKPTDYGYNMKDYEDIRALK